MVGYLEEWRSPARTLPLVWQSRLHPQGVVPARPLTGVKLVRGTDESRSAGGYLASKVFVFEGPSGGVHCVYLPLDPSRFPVFHWLVPTQSLSKLLWSGRKPMVHRLVHYQRPQNGGLGCLIRRVSGLLKDWLTWADRCWGTRWETHFLDWDPAPKLKVIISLGVKHHSPASDLPQSWKELYRESVVGSASDSLEERLS